MTADELRRLAVLIERTDHDAIDRAADYLRACADALDAGPVAWRYRYSGAGCWMLSAAPPDLCDPVIESCAALYPLAIPAPQPVSTADELDADRIEAIAHRTAWRYRKSSDPHHSDSYTFNRGALMDFAARLLAEAHPPRLQLPEPMTEDELWTAYDTAPEGWNRHTYGLRAIEAEVLRRVKEANNGR